MRISAHLVCYDISDPHRLRRVYRTMRGFGDHWQYSVFYCELSEVRKIELVGRLEAITHADEDQVLLIPLGPADGRSIRGVEVVGRPQARRTRGPFIV
ncbi:MAG: CRISPR-associated endonuclease Cas2 [Myxococcota bacterium]